MPKAGSKPRPTRAMTPPGGVNAAIVLADGVAFWGQGIGATGVAVGEVCFNTSITGYQEILTDPSYAGQIITFTFPHIGNVGANAEDIETTTPAARGLILRAAITEPSNWRATQHLDKWLKSHGLVGIAGVVFRAPITRSVERVIGRYDVSMEDVGRSARSLPLTGAAILLAHLLFVSLFFATYHFLFEAVGMDVPPHALILAGSVAAMAAIVPITVSGLGTREAVLLLLLEPFYSSPSQVVLAGLLWVFVLTYFLSGIVALPLWLLGLPRKPQAAASDLAAGS